jgi:NodT family efflux transporter outer membrane factor (OMF) lipoprotein
MKRPLSFPTSAALLGAVLLLGGCASIQPPPAPQLTGLPATWSGAGPAADAAAAHNAQNALLAWWRQFNDPLLTDLVTTALDANTGVASARAALRQARALQDVATAGLGPTVTGSADAQRSRASNSTANRFGAGLDASWELDLFGANRSGRDAAAASAQASAASLGDVQVSLAAEVALAYLTLRSGQARLAIAEANLAAQQETLQIASWRLQAGLADSLAAEQAQAAAAQTAATLPPLRTAIAQARHALAVLTGQPPAALDARLATAAPLPQPAATLALAGPADTLRQRPDVRAAEWRLAAEWARLAQADAALKPSFRLSGSLGLSALTLGGLTSGGAVAASLLGGLTLPVFDGGALRAAQRAQQAVLDQAQQTWRASVLAALQEVEDALVALRSDTERQQRLQAAASAATNAATLAGQRYRSGLVDFQTVLDTQRSQLSAQDALASSAADLAADHVRLYKSLGGGWANTAADTPPTPATSTP